MEPPREWLNEQPIDQPIEQPSVIARVERYALPAFVWWAGGMLVLSFMTFIAQEIVYLVVLWSVIGLLAALVLLFIAAYRVYDEITRLYADVQEMLHDIAQSMQPTAQILSSSQQPLQTQPVSQPSFDRDGVAIQFSEIFKEL